MSIPAISGACTDREEFLETSLKYSAKYFVGMGPLIGGLYLAAKSGGASNGLMGLVFVLFVVAYAYVLGIFPALIAATVWYGCVCLISYVSMDRLHKSPGAFLVGSFVISGLAGFSAELFWERLFLIPSQNTWAEAGAIAGCLVGFMAANGVLRSSGT